MSPYCVTLFVCCCRRLKPSEQHTNIERRFFAAAYPALAGTFGAQSVLFAKSCAEVVRTTAGGDSQLGRPEAYLMLIGLGVCVYMQLRLLNAGLAHAGALVPF